MTDQPPPGPYPPPPGAPSEPPRPPAAPPPGYPPPGYPPRPGPVAPPPMAPPMSAHAQQPQAPPQPSYTAPPPAPRPPRPPIVGAHLAALLLVAGVLLLVLANLVAAFSAGSGGFDIEFVDRLFLLGATGGGFFYSVPTILLLSILIIAALRLRDSSPGRFDALILIGALIAAAIVTLFVLLALLGSFAVDGLDPRFGFVLLLLGALVIAVGTTWYAYGEFQNSRPARPSPAAAPVYPQHYQQAYQPPPGPPPPSPGYPPPGYPPQG